MRPGRSALLAVIVVVLAAAAGFLAMEAGYRTWVWASQPSSLPKAATGDRIDIGVYDRSHWEYDPDYGFRYPPGRRIAYTHIVTDRVTRCATVDTINARGNIGPIRGDYDSAGLKVALFGDSFPAFIQDGTTFPALLQDRLEAATGEDVHVLNFGRDGTGILQILDLAAGMVAEWQPDLAVITFITDDLRRVRIWRTVTERDGETRVLTTTTPDPDPPLEAAADTYVVDARATGEWCRQTLAAGGQSPLVDRLAERYRNIAKGALHTSDGILDLGHSFLLSRILYGNPFLTEPRFRVPKLDLDDFRDDPGFRAAVDRLQASGVPVVLVHLPIYPEVLAGEIQFRGSDRALWDSLEAAFGQPIDSLLPHWPDLPDPAVMNASPQDYHPSPTGMAIIADGIRQVLRDRGALDRPQ